MRALGLVAAVIWVPAVSCTSDDGPGPATPATSVSTSVVPTPVEIVTGHLDAAFDRRDPAAARETVADDVVSHDPTLADGADAVALAVEALAADPGAPDEVIDVHRVVAEGDLVVVHSNEWWRPGAGTVPDPGLAVARIYRVEGGRIAEQWVVRQPAAASTPSGRTMFDGGGEPGADTSAEELVANRALVERFLAEVLEGGDRGVLAELVAPDYAQHNPLVADGVEALSSTLPLGAMPNTVHRLVAQGDLVAALVEYESGPAAAVDIFRVEGGRIAEHWDVLEAATPAAETAAGHDVFG